MNWKSLATGLLLSAAVALGAQQRTTVPVAGPLIGVVHCSDGSLRDIYGLPANLLYGAPLGRGVDAAAFSSAAGLVLRSGQIEYLGTDGTVLSAYATDEPNPLLAVSPVGAVKTSGFAVAMAWLPSSNLLLTWSGEP